MNNSLFYKYYDKIYSTKNYKEESSAVLNHYKNLKGNFPQSIIDVGCGTGSHDFYFAEAGCNVAGCDLDCSEIKIAQEKAREKNINNINFFCKDVDLIEQNNFELAVSLFNVISYITDLNYLEKFFTAINKRVKENGIFIFDCWNGTAALLDPPQVKESTIEIQDEVIKIKSVPSINYMRQTVDVKNSVEIISGNETNNFEFNYRQRLWSPEILKEILNRNGFNVLSLNKAMNFSVEADYSTWKIMFVCQKK
ncbi:MAG: class I SAM-dependent methyltransferase [Bacteroidetes bacterium]|nr:class I SAM-dependent methyltransferase [Bacteroidota bacterium]